MDQYAKAYPIFNRIRGYRSLQKMLHNLKRFDRNEIAKERAKIIEFYDEFGEKATKQAFGADRRLIYVWKKKLRYNSKTLESIVPESTRPIRTRTMKKDQRVIDFIC
jgi:hypothetical protein